MRPNFAIIALRLVLWALPVVVLSGLLMHRVWAEPSPAAPSAGAQVKVPVQTIRTGERPQIIYVELEVSSLPLAAPRLH